MAIWNTLRRARQWPGQAAFSARSRRANLRPRVNRAQATRRSRGTAHRFGFAVVPRAEVFAGRRPSNRPNGVLPPCSAQALESGIRRRLEKKSGQGRSPAPRGYGDFVVRLHCSCTLFHRIPPRRVATCASRARSTPSGCEAKLERFAAPDHRTSRRTLPACPGATPISTRRRSRQVVDRDWRAARAFPIPSRTPRQLPAS